MSEAFADRYALYVDMVNDALDAALLDETLHPAMREAMRYSTMPGGKRLRPVLVLAAHALCGGVLEKALPLALAVEMIHAYSLIHDDLPAMDNDTLRRGKPTSHVAFGEANAILAGDALLNYAFETMLASLPSDESLPYYGLAMRRIAEGAGAKGMIAGQAADIQSENASLENPVAREYILDYIHAHKTGALISASVMAGAILCAPSQEKLDALERYGEALGLAFQIVDDVLDTCGDARMGKSLGKDQSAGKLTFVRVYGIERAREMARTQTQNAIDALSVFGDEADFLRALAVEMESRQH